MRQPPLSSLDPIDPAPFLAVLEDRYGIDPAVFADYVLIRASRKHLSILPADLRAPAPPLPTSAGLYLLNTKGSYPKLTTEAAMTFGRHATRNVVEVTRDELTDYLLRRPLPATPRLTANLTGPGHCLVRHEELTFGVASYKPDLERIDSMFPKHWAGVFRPSGV